MSVLVSSGALFVHNFFKMMYKELLIRLLPTQDFIPVEGYPSYENVEKFPPTPSIAHSGMNKYWEVLISCV